MEKGLVSARQFLARWPDFGHGNPAPHSAGHSSPVAASVTVGSGFLSRIRPGGYGPPAVSDNPLCIVTLRSPGRASTASSARRNTSSGVR